MNWNTYTDFLVLSNVLRMASRLSETSLGLKLWQKHKFIDYKKRVFFKAYERSNLKKSLMLQILLQLMWLKIMFYFINLLIETKLEKLRSA